MNTTIIGVLDKVTEESASFERSQRQLVLHLPIHKTGSTALQRTLWSNEQKLNAAGYTYCPGRAEDAQHKFLVEAGDTRRMILEQIRREVGARSVMLSSEKAHMLDSNALRMLISEVAAVFEDWVIRVVVYVRRQDEAFASFYNQIVKFGSVAYSTDTAFSRFQRFFDYESYLDTIDGSLRVEDSLTVRIYERSKLKGGDITADFLECVGLSASFDLVGGESNSSMEKSVFKLKLAMNSCLEGAPNQLLKSLAGIMADASSGINGGKPDTDILSDLEHQLILASFRESNARMAVKYLRGETFSDFVGSKVDYTSSDEVALAGVLAHLSRYFFWLSNRGPEGKK